MISALLSFFRRSDPTAGPWRCFYCGTGTTMAPYAEVDESTPRKQSDFYERSTFFPKRGQVKLWPSCCFSCATNKDVEWNPIDFLDIWGKVKK